MRKPNGYWTYERCKEEAIRYNKKSDFQKHSSSAYNVIKKNNWVELTEHMLVFGNKYKRLIYVYEFSDNYCYIGLTGDINRRSEQHLNKDKNSSVYKHKISTGLEPKLVLMSDYIDVYEAIDLEENTLNLYKKNNWSILNKVKTGNIGSSNIKWSIEMCQMEANKYNSISEFQYNSGSAYNAALKCGWVDTICNHMIRKKCKNGYWNDRELCEVESKKYRNKREFQYGNWSAYNYSKINGWLDQFFMKELN